MAKIRVLLIVDPQNDFCPGGALAVKDGDQIFTVVNELLASPYFDIRIASRDAHPANHISFCSQHPGVKPFSTIEVDGHPQQVYPDHCVARTTGAAFHPAFNIDRVDYLVDKGMDPKVDSLSAFFDNLKRGESSLRGYLLKVAAHNGCQLEDIELSVVGLALDYCVAMSAIDAASLGMKTEIILEGTRAIDDRPEAIRALATSLSEHKVEIIHVAEFRQRERAHQHSRGVDSLRNGPQKAIQMSP